MKKIVLTLAVLATLPVLCSGALKKSVTWENIKAHPAPLPSSGAYREYPGKGLPA